MSRVETIGDCTLEPKYFDIACRRIEAAYAQPDIFLEAEKKAEQLSMLGKRTRRVAT